MLATAMIPTHSEMPPTPAVMIRSLASARICDYPFRPSEDTERDKHNDCTAPTLMDGTSLEHLLARSAQGERSAFAALYDQTAGRVYGLVKRIVLRADVAEDVAAEVFLQVWQQAHAFDQSRGSAIVWLLTIARSRALDALRRRGREKNDASLDAEPIALADPGPSGVELVGQFQDRSRIAQALARLAPTQQQCVALSFFQDMSHREIAAHLGMPLGTVKTTLRAAMHTLKELLQSGTGQAEESA